MTKIRKKRVKQLKIKYMNRATKQMIIIIIALLCIASFNIGLDIGVSNNYNHKGTTDTLVINVQNVSNDTTDTDDMEWGKLINAIIKVESEKKDSAKSDKGAVGQLQLMPVYIEDANRIVGDERYRLSDRYDKNISIEIFNVIQDHYNPTHDIYKAIKLHNPKAGKWYYDRVMEQIKNQEI